MASLVDCPEEIYDTILEFIPPPALRNLCLVNRRLRFIAEPRLYRRIEWTWQDPEIPAWIQPPRPPPPIQLLLRTLLSRPELGIHVRRLVLRGFNPLHRCPKLPTDCSGLDEAVSVVERFGVPYVDLWVRELRSGTVGAFVALLLSQTPQLEIIHADGSFAVEGQLVGLLIKSALQERHGHNLPTFTRVHKMIWDDDFKKTWQKGMRGRNFTSCLSGWELFSLPSVKTIAATINNPFPFAWPMDIPDPSNLTSLRLSHVREPLLCQLLAITRGLRSLEWNWYYDWGNYGYQPRPASLTRSPNIENPVVDLDQLAQAVLQVAGTLTELVVTGYIETYDIIEPEARAFIRGSLSGIISLEKLERLEAPVHMLMGFFTPPGKNTLPDPLPTNLEYLDISSDLAFEIDPDVWWEDDYHGMILDLIKPWLQHDYCMQATPQLRGIGVRVSLSWPSNPCPDHFCTLWHYRDLDETLRRGRMEGEFVVGKGAS